MEETKLLYEIIADLWKFCHKYSELLEANKSIDWDILVKEYADMTDGKSENADARLKKLRSMLFMQAFNYFREREKELQSDLSD